MATRRTDATRDATAAADSRGMPPQLATIDAFSAIGTPKSGRADAKRTAKGKGGPKAPPKINLKPIVEACLDEGLDPAVEIAKVLKGRPVYNQDGTPEIDPVTGGQRLEYDVDGDVRLRTLNSLLEYMQPKLKAVEVKMSGSLDLTSEQLDQRLTALLSKINEG